MAEYLYSAGSVFDLRLLHPGGIYLSIQANVLSSGFPIAAWLTRILQEDRQPFCPFTRKNNVNYFNARFAKARFVSERFSEKSGRAGCAKSLQSSPRNDNHLAPCP